METTEKNPEILDSDGRMAETSTSARRNPMQRLQGKETRKNAIDAMCCQCMGGPDDPGWQREIRNCTSGPDSRAPCPLWNFRPYK